MSIKKMRLERNSRPAPDDGPLFRWAAMRPCETNKSLPRPARIIARRFGLAPLRACLIAELAGFPMEANNHV